MLRFLAAAISKFGIKVDTGLFRHNAQACSQQIVAPPDINNHLQHTLLLAQAHFLNSCH